MKWIAHILLIVILTGCIRIPEEDWIISQRSQSEPLRQVADCTAIGLSQLTRDQLSATQKTSPQSMRTPELNAKGFSFVSWNIHKEKGEGWREDFQNLSRNADILVLQEAYLSNALKHMLQQEKYQWDMTAAFAYRQIEAGVLTAARIMPNYICTFRDTEPITRVPKSVLITRYPMSGTHRDLLVANIHAINFTMGDTAFQKQMDRLKDVLSAHQGPVIVSGDFNTWSSRRMSQVNAMAEGLDLTTVTFDGSHRSRFFGQYVDHVYYRGLEMKHAATPIVDSSDHNPLTVVFRLADDPVPGI